uniref:Uncharacterized protein n=1 Tax=Arundo donax TaxID=35708 RepID=A0A0A9ET76_ARUDO
MVAHHCRPIRSSPRDVLVTGSGRNTGRACASPQVKPVSGEVGPRVRGRGPRRTTATVHGQPLPRCASTGRAASSQAG